MQTIISIWVQSFAQLLLSSVGLCVLASLSLKYLFGSRRLLLLLHFFVADEIWKVGLIPGNLGQRNENKLLEKTPQHTAMLHFHTHEKTASLEPIDPYLVKRFHCTDSSYSLNGIGWCWSASQAFLAPVLKIINIRSLITIIGRWDMKSTPNCCLLNKLNPSYQCLLMKGNMSSKRETVYMNVSHF